MLPTSSEIAHILPNNYVKTEPYPDIYSTSPADAELSVYPQTSYERAVGDPRRAADGNRDPFQLQDSSIWSRQPWNQWHTGQPLETTIDTRSNGKWRSSFEFFMFSLGYIFPCMLFVFDFFFQKSVS